MRAAALAALVVVAAACGADEPSSPPAATVPEAVAPGLPTTTTVPVPPPCLSLGIPAYVAPAELRTLAGLPGLEYVVLNPASGPDVERDDELASVVLALQGAGVQVLGYVHTSYGERPLGVVRDEIGRYRAWYAVDGIFVDEVTNGPAGLPYYRQVAGAAGELVVALNPGTPTVAGYDELAELIVTFEDRWEVYRDAVPPERVPDVEQWHLVLDTPAEAVPEALELAAQRGASVVDLTELGRSETWNRLPSHLPAQVAEVIRLNRERRCAP